ncbi:MFS transporter [Kribbella flavida]|uniref:MFS transporter n=1 Tax=Kribbella flavida TaxID=182640 RepID=UPI00192C3F6D|nr:MFS transporter [Kribbella flavida]
MLRHRDFRLLLAGQTTSQLGAQVSGVAIPLLAVLTLDASPLQLGLLGASSTLAFAVIGLPAGAWVDRFRRRPLLVGSDLTRCVLLATIPLAALTGTLTMTQLIVVSLLTGVARVFFDVGYQSYLPAVVGKGQVLAGNSALEAIRASGQVVGPGLGGWLVAIAGAANVIAVQAVTFAVSAACLLGIRTAEPAPRRTEGSLREQIRAGLTFVLRTRVLRSLVLSSALGNFAFALASAVTMIFLVRELGLSPTLVGLVFAGASLTVVLGASITPRLARRFGSARIIWLAPAVMGPFGLLAPLAQPEWSVELVVALVLVGSATGELGQIIYAITSVSLRQRLCPDELLGRVNATTRFAIMALFPLGALLGGVLGEYVGLRATLVVALGLIAVSPLPAWLALRGIREVEEVPSWVRAG